MTFPTREAETAQNGVSVQTYASASDDDSLHAHFPAERSEPLFTPPMETWSQLHSYVLLNQKLRPQNESEVRKRRLFKF